MSQRLCLKVADWRRSVDFAPDCASTLIERGRSHAANTSINVALAVSCPNNPNIQETPCRRLESRGRFDRADCVMR
jgi:hypothetical protein